MGSNTITREDALRAWALSQVGSPYVMGGTGKGCTPAYRRARAEQYPGSAAAIRRNCPVMAGKQSGCGGCRYQGKRCYDCAQLIRWGCDAAGIRGVNISGATSQWRKGDYAAKGVLAEASGGRVMILFREDEPGVMGHVGIGLGDGTVVHASGHDTGVIRTTVSAGRWTHYALPLGLDEAADAPAAPLPSPDPEAPAQGRDTIRKGASGALVTQAQGLLIRAGYPLPRCGADGKFGEETREAVRDFQRAEGLQADGIIGPKTWAALDKAAGATEDVCTVTIPGLSRAQALELVQAWPGAWVG